MEQSNFLLVNAKALPEVYERVVQAKELLSSGSVANVSEAVKAVGLSRSAFYKYRNEVFRYLGNNDTRIVNISALLSDRAGVFSALTAKLYKKGVNILTINQNLPVDETAAVTLSVRTDNLTVPLEDLVSSLRRIDGVLSIKIV